MIDNIEQLLEHPGSGARLRGFYRLHVVENDREGKPQIVGDSGWRENQITNNGFDNYLSRVIAAMAGSSLAAYAALGTGTVPASNATALPGELGDAANCRCTLASTTTGSKTVQFTFTLASGIVTATRALANVGLFAVSTTQAGTLFAGNTYTSSALATNQAVNGTYQIQFS